MSNMNLCTCNLPHLQSVHAQRFPNTMVKIDMCLNRQNIPVTSEELGEGHKPSRRKGKSLKVNHQQSPDGGPERLGRKMRRLWAALLKQFQGNETMTGQVGAREVALQIVREMYFLLFDLTPTPLPFGSRTRLSQNPVFCSRTSCKMHLKEAAAHFLVSRHNFQGKRQCILLCQRNIPGCLKNEVLFVIPHSSLFLTQIYRF